MHCKGITFSYKFQTFDAFFTKKLHIFFVFLSAGIHTHYYNSSFRMDKKNLRNIKKWVVYLPIHYFFCIFADNLHF